MGGKSVDEVGFSLQEELCFSEKFVDIFKGMYLYMYSYKNVPV